jgi:hypothetical protein
VYKTTVETQKKVIAKLEKLLQAKLVGGGGGRNRSGSKFVSDADLHAPPQVDVYSIPADHPAVQAAAAAAAEAAAAEAAEAAREEVRLEAAKSGVKYEPPPPRYAI